jgi:type VI secretion system protein ImpH
MDNEERTAADSLDADLRDRPFDFDFFQAVRRFECINSDLPRIGHSRRPQNDPIRFCQNVSLAFAPSTISAYSEATDQDPAKMTVNFFGLLGQGGPMPLAITEYIYNRLQNHKDKTLTAFLDIFHHRSISLFYRAWACNQQCVSYDRKDEDRFAVYIGSLFGIGDDSFRNRDALPDVAKLHYSGRLICQTRNVEGLREILKDYFEVTVAIQQFVGQWINLPQNYLCQLDSSCENTKLGYTTIVGSRFWECQQKFRIMLGPMDLSRYQAFLPGSDSIRRLIAWIKNYVGDEFLWEIQLILKASMIPRLCLGRMGQLGWSSWLGSRKFQKDADNLVLRSLDT